MQVGAYPLPPSLITRSTQPSSSLPGPNSLPGCSLLIWTPPVRKNSENNRRVLKSHRPVRPGEYESLAPEKKEQVPDFLDPAPTHQNGSPGGSRVSCSLPGRPEAQCLAHLPNKHSCSDFQTDGDHLPPSLGLPGYIRSKSSALDLPRASTNCKIPSL